MELMDDVLLGYNTFVMITLHPFRDVPSVEGIWLAIFLQDLPQRLLDPLYTDVSNMS